MRVHSLSSGCFLLLCLAFAVSLCNADNRKTFEVVGLGECADCKENNYKNSQAFSGLLVSIDCKLKDGKMKRFGVGELDEGGEFKVSIPEKIVEDGQKLKEKCYAQLHSAAAVPCPAHNGVEAAKIVFKSQINGKHTFGPVKNLKFSTALCTSKFLWPLFKYPPLHKIHSWKKHFPKSFFPPLKHFGHHPWFLPPPNPIYKPPVYKPPVEKPPVYKPPVEKPPVYKPPVEKPPVYKPPVEKPPVYKPPVEKPPVYKPPIEKPPVYKPPVEKPPVYKPPVEKPPVYKPPVEKPPVYKPPVEKPPVYKPPVEKPPVYKPPVEKPPVYKPPVEKPPVYKPPVYKPPVEKPPVYKPPVEKPPVYKPPVEKPPVYKPPEVTKPLPPPTPLYPFPPFVKKPCPPLQKIFHHPKFGHFPPLPPFHP